VASTMRFRALRVVSETVVELDYFTDDGAVRTFTFALEDHGGIRTITPPLDWPAIGVHSSIDDGAPWKLAGHALTLHHTPLPIDEFLKATRHGSASYDLGPTRISGARLSWSFSPYDYSLSMDRGLAERFRVLLLTRAAHGRDFALEAEGKTLSVVPGERVEILPNNRSDSVQTLKIDAISARNLATAIVTKPGSVVIPLAPGWSLVLLIVA
jgi:hypothetical protein